MSERRVLEDYRGHKLLAAFHQGNYKGRVWGRDEKLLTELNGSGITELVIALKDYVDSSFTNKANSRTSPPEVREYVRAFQNILEKLPDGYLAMLKAHYKSPSRTMTATQLAKAGGYPNWRTANLHYGLLGKRLYEELPIQLPKYPDGKFIYTFSLATEGDLNQDEAQWQWKMRPEVAEAVNQLGLHN
jgi:hypothetical protein